MAVQNIPRPEHDESRESLVGAAAAVLAARRRDIPGDFLVELFGRAPPEDLERYGAAELAGIAEQSWSFLLQRPPSASKIALVPLTSSPSVAVLDILNDDMPFLVDSVLGELSERGFDLRLVVHPVFTVERDEAGRLTAFRGTRRGEGHRESFIHIHVAGSKVSSPTCASRSRIGGRCWRAPTKWPPS
jgi:glutamate dehydrogenase